MWWVERVLRRVPVKPNANSIQFSLQQRSLLSTFRTIKDHQNQVTRLSLSVTSTNNYRSNMPTLAAEITCLPRPFPSEAPSIIPGKSRIWISAPPYSNTPGIAVSVVNEYAAASLLVLVILDRKVDLPTEGKPTRATRASPLLLTSKPEPPPPPAPVGSRSWALRRASFLMSLVVAWFGLKVRGISTP